MHAIRVQNDVMAALNLHYLASFRFFHNGAVAKNYIDQLQSGPVESRLEPSSSYKAILQPWPHVSGV